MKRGEIDVFLTTSIGGILKCKFNETTCKLYYIILKNGMCYML